MGQSVEYYLSKGLDQKMAAYFAAGRRKITEIIANDDFTLTLTFDNGEQRLYNVLPMLQLNTVFAHFRSLDNFRRVYLDEQNCVSWDIDPSIDRTVVWSNKVDLCPDTCYVDSIPIAGGAASV